MESKPRKMRLRGAHLQDLECSSGSRREMLLTGYSTKGTRVEITLEVDQFELPCALRTLSETQSKMIRSERAKHRRWRRYARDAWQGIDNAIEKEND